MPYKKSITTLGSVSLLAATVLGPAIAILPAAVANAGLIPSVCILILLWFMSSMCGSMLCAALAAIPENHRFDHRVEFVGAVRFYFGERLFRLASLLVNTGFALNIIINVVQSATVMDQLIADMVGTTCGVVVSFPPRIVCHRAPLLPDALFCTKFATTATCLSDAALGCNWVGARCVPDARTLWGRFFPVVFTQGFLLVCLVSIPLGMGNLDASIPLQIGSVLFTGAIVLAWCLGFVDQIDTLGAAYIRSHEVPLVGSGMSIAGLIGLGLFCTCFAHYLPSWLSEKQNSVSVNKVIWTSSSICLACNIAIGVGGALAFGSEFHTGMSHDILEVFAFSGRPNSLIMRLCRLGVYLFPPLVVLPGIPVSAVMLKFNLVQSGCSEMVGAIGGVIAPFVLALCFLSHQAEVNTVVAWLSIIVLSSIDIVIPIALYLSHIQWKVHSRAAVTPTSTSMNAAGIATASAELNSFVQSPFTLLTVSPPSRQGTPPGSDDDEAADVEHDETAAAAMAYLAEQAALRAKQRQQEAADAALAAATATTAVADHRPSVEAPPPAIQVVSEMGEAVPLATSGGAAARGQRQRQRQGRQSDKANYGSFVAARASIVEHHDAHCALYEDHLSLEWQVIICKAMLGVFGLLLVVTVGYACVPAVQDAAVDVLEAGGQPSNAPSHGGTNAPTSATPAPDAGEQDEIAYEYSLARDVAEAEWRRRRELRRERQRRKLKREMHHGWNDPVIPQHVSHMLLGVHNIWNWRNMSGHGAAAAAAAANGERR